MNQNKILEGILRELKNSGGSTRKKATFTTSKVKTQRETAEEHIRKNQRKIEKQKKEFNKLWDSQKPSIGTRNLVRRFRQQSKEYCNPMLEYSMRLIGLLTAVGYANDEILKGIDTEGHMKISEQEMSIIGQKMMRLKMMELAADSMGLEETLLERILGIQIAKDFGGHANTSASNAPPVKRTKHIQQVNNNVSKKESLFSPERRKKPSPKRG